MFVYLCWYFVMIKDNFYVIQRDNNICDRLKAWQKMKDEQTKERKEKKKFSFCLVLVHSIFGSFIWFLSIFHHLDVMLNVNLTNKLNCCCYINIDQSTVQWILNRNISVWNTLITFSLLWFNSFNFIAFHFIFMFISFSLYFMFTFVHLLFFINIILMMMLMSQIEIQFPFHVIIYIKFQWHQFFYLKNVQKQKSKCQLHYNYINPNLGKFNLIFISVDHDYVHVHVHVCMYSKFVSFIYYFFLMNFPFTCWYALVKVFYKQIDI